MSHLRRRPRPVHLNALQRAINGARKLSQEDVQLLRSGMRQAFDDFGRGVRCASHWLTMADALNVAESLCDMGICSDDASRQRVLDGQAVLATVRMRFGERGTWALRAAERQQLDDALWLHGVQLEHCSLREFSSAVDRTAERVRQARTGNAPAGAIVIDGGIGSCSQPQP